MSSTTKRPLTTRVATTVDRSDPGELAARSHEHIAGVIAVSMLAEPDALEDLDLVVHK